MRAEQPLPSIKAFSLQARKTQILGTSVRKQTNKNLPVQKRDEYVSRTTTLSHVPICFAWVEG